MSTKLQTPDAGAPRAPAAPQLPGADSATGHAQEEALRRPYEEGFYASVPTPTRRFFRRFLPWQLWRFAMINLRMIRMIGKSHN